MLVFCVISTLIPQVIDCFAKIRGKLGYISQIWQPLKQKEGLHIIQASYHNETSCCDEMTHHNKTSLHHEIMHHELMGMIIQHLIISQLWIWDSNILASFRGSCNGSEALIVWSPPWIPVLITTNWKSSHKHLSIITNKNY